MAEDGAGRLRLSGMLVAARRNGDCAASVHSPLRGSKQINKRTINDMGLMTPSTGLRPWLEYDPALRA